MRCLSTFCKCKMIVCIDIFYCRETLYSIFFSLYNNVSYIVIVDCCEYIEEAQQLFLTQIQLGGRLFSVFTPELVPLYRTVCLLSFCGSWQNFQPLWKYTYRKKSCEKMCVIMLNKKKKKKKRNSKEVGKTNCFSSVVFCFGAAIAKKKKK